MSGRMATNRIITIAIIVVSTGHGVDCKDTFANKSAGFGPSDHRRYLLEVQVDVDGRRGSTFDFSGMTFEVSWCSQLQLQTIYAHYKAMYLVPSKSSGVN